MSNTLAAEFCRKYSLVSSEPIGKGSYAVVYKCVHRETKKEFALKLVDKSIAGPRDIDSVAFEISVMKHIGYHPHVIHLVDHFETQSYLYLVLDLVSGGMLFDSIVELSHYSEHCAAVLVHNILSALVHIHSKGVIHRDLKPENLLLRKKKSLANATDTSYLADVCLADFGMAGMVPSRACCGSPSYIAPEVIKVGYYNIQKTPYDTKCDVWSLGVITYILLSGKMPFGGVSHKEIFSRIVANEWTFAGDIWQTISPVAMSFIKVCLTPEPGERPSAQDLLQHPWVNTVQPDLHLKESVKELRFFNAQQKWRVVLRVFSTTQMLLGHLDFTPPFVKYLRHGDKFSTVIELRSQTHPDKVHYVDFSKALQQPQGWCIQDCCTCHSATVCRHIQNVYEFLFIGQRRIDVHPFVDELKLLKCEAEENLKKRLFSKKSREKLARVTQVIKSAYAFSDAFLATSEDVRKHNVMLSIAATAALR